MEEQKIADLVSASYRLAMQLMLKEQLTEEEQRFMDCVNVCADANIQGRAA